MFLCCGSGLMLCLWNPYMGYGYVSYYI
ncbi:hypothetical protein PCHDK_000547900 [Plasmodium chabaudi adami]|uniref:Uncharacterized protein n=1 Tax=Plasmodium chabaudi adami TaxID=5826 RepID=A0A1D3LAD6_PLACE|nr:hypothetical protein PCHDK_000547900 [Plasmodium chabaudi adami]